jgi:crotonobetainyl-CoA:carnitine CoA-transferase CaiB-like acyl-CoA transferase
MTTATPLAAVRVLDLSTTQAGRTAGMLLADLGADVVRVVPSGWEPAPAGSPEGPADMTWDRGKRFTSVTNPAVLRRLAHVADVVLDDSSTGERSLDPAALLAESPWLVHVAMPPYGSAGRWRELPSDPLLVSALGGFATFHPSHEPGSPVASVVPMVSAVHGALGAMLAAAGLLGVRRDGHGRALETSGLHACASCLSTLVVEGIDAEEIVTPDGRVASRPSFRTYRCADGLYLHLSTLTVEFFLPALAALDRMDVMVLPGVDGDFVNTLRPPLSTVVGDELQRTFAERPRDEWLEILTAAGIPCAPVLSREQWLTSDIVAAAAPPVSLPHPEAGPVLLPGPALALSGAVLEIRHLAGPGHAVPAEDLWQDPRPREDPAGVAPALPLTGLRAVDLATFLAAPMVTALLADLGATVVKVQPPQGDPYSAFAPAYAAVNHAKTIVSVDLRSPEGHAGLLGLTAQADVLVDNLRPAVAARLGLTDADLRAANPALVHGSVSAFGRSGAYADLPGFDPVLQSRSGLATAQGGADEPVPTAAPTVDVATGVLTALGVLAALVERHETGEGGHVIASLAATSTFLQLAELVDYPGRPSPEQGDRDYRGPEPTRRYHRAADGWLALAATTDEHRRAVTELLGLATPTHEAVAAALAREPVEHWLAALRERGVPATTVATRSGFLTDPTLVANRLTHVVRDPELGRFRLLRGYFDSVLPGPTVPARETTQWRPAVGEVRAGYTVVSDPDP